MTIPRRCNNGRGSSNGCALWNVRVWIQTHAEMGTTTGHNTIRAAQPCIMMASAASDELPRTAGRRVSNFICEPTCAAMLAALKSAEEGESPAAVLLCSASASLRLWPFLSASELPVMLAVNAKLPRKPASARSNCSHVEQ